MADIFTEVEEELRRDKYNTLLRRYGLWVLGAVAAFILAVALYTMVWEPMQRDRIYSVSDAYSEAVALEEAGQGDAAAGAYRALVEGEHNGYAVLALMRLADMAAQQGNREEAVGLLDSAAARADDASVAGLARIRALYLLADTADYSEILRRAEPLSGADSGYRASAREVIALGALRSGDLQRARSEYQYLTLAPETPQGVRNRASEGLAAVERAERDSAGEESPQ